MHLPSHAFPIPPPRTAVGGPLQTLLRDPSLTWAASGWDASDARKMEAAFGKGVCTAMRVVDVQVGAFIIGVASRKQKRSFVRAVSGHGRGDVRDAQAGGNERRG